LPKTQAGIFPSGSPSQVRSSGFSSVSWRRRLFPGNAKNPMSITAIVFVLIIVLFGFDSTRQVKARRQGNRLRDAQQPFTRCCDSRIRCGWQRDRGARAQGRVQRVTFLCGATHRPGQADIDTPRRCSIPPGRRRMASLTAIMKQSFMNKGALPNRGLGTRK